MSLQVMDYCFWTREALMLNKHVQACQSICSENFLSVPPDRTCKHPCNWVALKGPLLGSKCTNICNCTILLILASCYKRTIVAEFAVLVWKAVFIDPFKAKTVTGISSFVFG